MRSALAKLRKTVKQIIFVGLLMVALMAFNAIPLIPKQFYYWLSSVVAIGLLVWTIFKFKGKSDKYINERGYVVLAKVNELEHRFIAMQLLCRDLTPNEVVHHINGNKTDNHVRNLCLMDGERHEHFHSWLRWKKEKNRRYPTIAQQKRVLIDEYGGTLLEHIRPTMIKNAPTQTDGTKGNDISADDLEIFIVRRNNLTNKVFVEFDEEVLISPDGKDVELDTERFGPSEEMFETELTENQKNACRDKTKQRALKLSKEQKQHELQKKLFIELRKERKRLADERGVPAYIVFDDKTLTEISEVMPESESLLRQIKGVGPEKLRLYGAHFINIVKKFKNAG
jgi:hypothetical protein